MMNVQMYLQTNGQFDILMSKHTDEHLNTLMDIQTYPSHKYQPN